MVNAGQHRDVKGTPPALEESWWDAVLAEDENRSSSSNSRLHRENESNYIQSNNPVFGEEPELLDWEYVLRLYEQDQVINMKVNSYNRGGLLVESERLHGFVPLSLLLDFKEGEEKNEGGLEHHLNRILQLKIIECNPENKRVVFSERAAQAEPGRRIQLLNHLQAGDCVSGKVTNITDFGVFVDLGGVEGLVHVSEISWGRVRHPTDAVALDQEVEVYVIRVDNERSRIALSFKRLQPNPWETVHNRYHPGQLAEAVVTSIVPFGAFARLEEGLDGLIHISEIQTGVDDVLLKNPLQEGQRVQVRILNVDAAKQRLGLSLHIYE
ncbi:30S ribosomal protein S1 [Chloroflexota bacterium]